MIWAKRVILAIPFAVAGLLTVLVNIADPLHWHSEQIAGFRFMFGTPWDWLLDHGSFAGRHARWLEAILDDLVLLWIPALLYSVCF